MTQQHETSAPTTGTHRTTVFDPVRVGQWDLPQRFVMAPMTRSRAGADQVPTDMNATYYAQRAGAGLIIAEGTQPSAVGQGYLDSPGIHTPAQVEGWRKVADAVHGRGGRIVVQLMHAGRVSHTDNKDGLESVAPSALQAPGQMFTAAGMQDHDVPRALETDEVAGIVEEYAHAARCAVEAGLDGVELHAANGYLLHQFLAPSANERTDRYGADAEGRARLTIEVAQAVAEAIGGDRVGIRISPGFHVNGIAEDDGGDIAATYGLLVDHLAPLGLAYLSVLADPASDLVQDLRSRFGGVLVVNNVSQETDLAEVQAYVDGGHADLVAVARGFLANPDLVERWRTGAELNEADPATFYGGDARGYVDYPTLDDLPETA